MSAPTAAPSKKIIIAYDESEVGHQVIVALAINEDISKIEGSGGWQAPALGGIDMSHDFREVIRMLEEQGRECLAEAVHAIHQTGVVSILTCGKSVQGFHFLIAEILRGHTTEELTKFAKEQQADIVICGNRGIGYLKRKLIGSTSEYLTHHLDCTVMVVRVHPDTKK